MATDTTDLRYDPPALMAYNTVYYWKVAAKNSAGSTISPVWIFTTQLSNLLAPAQVSYSSPANGAIGQPITHTLIWNSAQNATSYEVYFGNANPPPYYNTTTETDYPLTGLTPGQVYFWRIDSLNGSFKTTNNTVWSFSCASVPGNNFTGYYPANSNYNVQPTVSFYWSAVANATSYDVYFGMSTTPPLVDSDNTDLYYDPPGVLDYSAAYYWKLVAKNPAGTTASETWGFTTADAPGRAPYYQASNVSPGNNTYNVSLTPTLIWRPRNPANYSNGPTDFFDVYLDTVNPPVNKVATTVETTHTISTPLTQSTLYYWSVQSQNSYGESTSGSRTIWSFTTVGAPEPPVQAISYNWPPNNNTNMPVTAMFGWQHYYYPYAASYDIYYGTTNPPPFVANTPADFSNTNYMKYDPPGIWDYDTTYYWQIVGKNDAGEVKGPVWNFKTETVTTNTPTSNDTALPFSPPNNAIVTSLTPTLDWYVDNDDYCDRYRVLCDTNATPTTEVAVISETSYAFTTPLSPDTKYYWRIQSGNGASGTVYWTTTYNFTYSFNTPGIPAAVTNGTPSNGATNQAVSTAVSWNAPTGAQYYDVYFDEAPTPTGTTKVLSDTTERVYDFPGLLNYGATYNWRVDAKNEAGTTTGTDLSFGVEALAAVQPGTFTLVSPGNTSGGNTITPTLRWNAATDATSYNIYLGTDPNPPLVASIADTMYTSPTALTSGTTYFWWIEAVNGAETRTTTPWRFDTAGAPGRNFTTRYPANFASNVPPSTHLSWNHIADATSYDVYFGTTYPPVLVDNQLYDSSSTNQYYEPAGLLSYDTYYYWKILAKNSGGNTESETWVFQVESDVATTPGAFLYITPPSPSDNSFNNILAATFRWNPSQDAKYYEIHMDTTYSSPLSNMVATTTELAYTVAGPLAVGTTYYWQIKARNSTYTRVTSVYTFSTLNQGPAQLFNYSYPSNTWTNVAAATPLVWLHYTNATSYDVYFGTDSPPPLVTNIPYDPNMQYQKYDPPGTLLYSTVYYWQIGARNDAGVIKGDIWKFTTYSSASTPSNRVGYISPPSPSNTAVNISLTPTFEWYVNSNSSAYINQFDVRLGTSNPPPIVATISDTSYTSPTALSPGTLYYWQIDPRNSTVTNTGTLWSFNTTDAPAQAFSYSYPGNNWTVTPVVTPFMWQHYPNAASYDIYYGTTNPPPLMDTIPADFSNTTYMKYDPPGIWDYDTTYFWQIVAKEGSGEVKGPVWYFKTETITANTPQYSYISAFAPGNGSTNPSLTPTLSWYINNPTYCDRFRVYCDTNSTPTTLIATISETDYAFATPLAPGTRYYWRIQLGNGASGMVWATNYAFTYNFWTPGTPSAVTSGTPSNGSGNVMVSTSVYWNAPTGAQFYDVYFDEAPTPTGTTKVLSDTTERVYDFPGLLNYNTTYNWRVDAKTIAGTATGTNFWFTTEALADVSPGAPSLVSPSNSAVNLSLTPTLRWNAGQDAISYNIYLGTDPNPPLVANIADTMYTSPTALTAGVTYVWRIESVNGALTNTTGTWCFVTESGPGNNFTSLVPANNAANVPTSQYLGWAAVSGATAYDVYFGDSYPPVQVATDITDLRYNPPALLAYNTGYYWRLTAKNSAGSTLSPVWVFTSEFSPFGAPTAVIYSLPSNNSFNQPITSTLVWSASQYATSYDVYFGDTNPPPFYDNTTETQYSVTGLTPGQTYYWRIDTLNGTIRITNPAVWRFGTLVQGPAQAFSYSYPSNTWSNTAVATPLVWNHYANATSYDVYFGTDSPPPLVTNIPYDPNMQHQKYDPPGTLLYNTVYYWQIGARNSIGAIKGDIWYFTTYDSAATPSNRISYMSPPSPANTTVNISLTPTFEWYVNSNSSAYINQFDVRLGTSNPPPIVATISDTSYTPPTALSPGTLYYWQIDPRNSTVTNTGTLQSFTTVATPPAALFNYIYPGNAATNIPVTQNLSWYGVNGATEYDIYFGTTDPPPYLATQSHDPSIDGYNPNCQVYEPAGNLDFNIRYYWQIRARNEAGEIQGNTFYFNTSNTILYAPNANQSLLQPSNNATVYTLTPVLSWYTGTSEAQNRRCPITYYLRVGTDNPPAATHVLTTTETSCVVPAGAAPLPNTRYNWAIDTENDFGSRAATAYTGYFNTGAVAGGGASGPLGGAQVITFCPANGSTTAPIVTSLYWYGVLGATSYDVYLDTANPPALAANVVHDGNISCQYYDPPGTLAVSTVYYWQVAARNGAGSVASDVWSFTTHATQTIVPNNLPGLLNPPNDTTSLVIPKPTLIWYEANNSWSTFNNPNNNRATYKYDVYLDTVNPPVVKILTDTAETSYKFSAPLDPGRYYWRANAKNSAGAVLNGTVWQFAVCGAPGAVISGAPANNAVDVPVSAGLAWDAAPNAETYDVYLDSGIVVPTTRIATDTVLTVCDPVGLLAYDTSYSWRVDARSSAGTVQGNVLYFTTESAPGAAPGAPVNVSPANQASGVTITPTLVWNAASGAESYNVYLGSNANPPLVANIVESNYTSPTALAAGGLYYWRIEAVNTSDTTTGPTWSFNATGLPGMVFGSAAPANGATGVSTSLALQWDAVINAASYDIYLGTSNPPALDGNTASNSYDTGGLLAGTVYYWQIVARNDSGSAADVVRMFTTGTGGGGVPGEAVNLAPANGADSQALTTTLTWNYAANATSYAVHFGTANPPPEITSLSGASYQATGLTPGYIYYWRIDAGNGTITTTGTVWSFSTLVFPGDNFTVMSPANGAVDVPVSAYLSWNAVTNADSYDVYFGASNPPAFIFNTTDQRYDPPGLLSYGTLYYWQIRAKNPIGETADIVRTFITASSSNLAPAAVTNLSPSNGAANISTNPTLYWTTVSYATSYDVRFGTANPPPLLDNTTESSYPATGLSGGAVYFWRIDARNGAAVTEGTVWSFVTADNPAAIFAGRYPSYNAANVPVSAYIGWNGVTNAASYDVYFGKANPPAFVGNIAHSSLMTTQYYDPPGLLDFSTVYYWKVVAKGDGGNIGDVVWFFTTEGPATMAPFSSQIPGLLYPSQTSNIPLNITLAWQPNASYPGRSIAVYDVYFGTTNPPAYLGSTIEMSYNVGPLARQQVYYWRIDSRNAYGTLLGNVWWFRTTSESAPVDNIVQQIYPSDNTSNWPVVAPVMWYNCANAASYDVYFGTGNPPQFVGNIPHDNTLTYQRYDPPGLMYYGATYYWKIIARNDAGSIEGPVWIFSTENPPTSGPYRVYNSLPANNSQQVQPVNLLWNDWSNHSNYSGRTQWYEVWIGNPTPVLYATTVESSYSPSTLTAGTWYWTVKAYNSYGMVNSSSSDYYFHLSAPTAPTNPYPGNNASGQSASVALTWSGPSNATSYDVYMDMEPTNPPTTLVTTTTGTRFEPVGSLDYGNVRYYWRVDAKNDYGITEGTVWNFRTENTPGTPPPGVTTVTYPNNGLSNVPTECTLAWPAVLRATSYQVCIGTDNPPPLVATISETSYTITLSPDRLYHWQIKSMNSYGTMDGTTWYFNTIPLPCYRFHYSNSRRPSTNATNIPITQYLAWGQVSNAASYDVYFGDTNPPPFSGNVLYNPISNWEYYNPGGVMEYSTVYYWRVVARNDAGSVSSPVWRFTTENSSSTPPVAVLTATIDPADSATQVSINPTLSWGASARATSYDVYFGDSYPPEAVTNTTETTYVPGVLMVNTTYYWQIDARNSAGIAAGPTGWNFKTVDTLPVQVSGTPSPDNESTGIAITTPLAWTAASGATSYDVYLDTTSTGWTPVASNTETRYDIPSVLSYDTVYYWKIDSRNDLGATAGNIWKFTTEASPTGAPAQVPNSPAPTNSATEVALSPQLIWQPSTGADSYNVYFGEALPGTPNTATTEVVWSPGALTASTTFSWRIDAVNDGGITAGNVWTFTTLTAPDAAGTPTPSNGAVDIGMTQQLTWTASARATSYDVYFGTTDTPPFVLNTVYLNFNPGVLSYNITYYWKVEAKNDAGITSGTVWNFTTQSTPAQVSSGTPANTATGIPIDQQLSWSAVSGATGYYVYFGTNGFPAYDGYTTGTTYDPSTLNNNTTYYWRVDAMNNAGITIGTIWRFKTIP